MYVFIYYISISIWDYLFSSKEMGIGFIIIINLRHFELYYYCCYLLKYCIA